MPTPNLMKFAKEGTVFRQAFAEYLKVEKPEWLQGNSFMPMIRREKEEINDYIYAEQGYG